MNISLNQFLLKFLWYVRQIWKIQLTGAIFFKGLTFFDWTYSVTSMHDLPVYMMEELPFAYELSVEYSENSYVWF